MAHVCTACTCVTIFSTGSKFQPVYNTTLIFKPPVLMCSCSKWFNISASHWLKALDPAMLREVSSTCCKARTLFVASLCPFLLQNHPQRNGYTWPVGIGIPIIPTTNQIGEWSPPHDKSLRAPLFTRVHKTNSLHCSQANYCLFNLTHLCQVLCNITWLWYGTYM